MKVVAECNGTEFERTANVMDLSYVPEEMTFADRDIKWVLLIPKVLHVANL